MSGLLGDLVVLLADQDMASAFDGVFNRPESFGIRTISYKIYVHPHHDPGCLLSGHDLLRQFARQYHHALVAFDKEGCGKEHSSSAELEREVALRLSQSGWGERAAALVIEPELEVWVWSDSPHVGAIFGWQEEMAGFKAWLREAGYLDGTDVKPGKPKEAMEEVLRLVKKPRSSAIYRELAEKVSLERCQDAAFLKLKNLLRQWFPPE